MENQLDEPVGYRRPPKSNQFKPGQSGNPKGRPKGARNLSALLEEELNQKVPVTENGRRKRIPKGRLAVRQQVNKAAQGDSKAFQAIARMQQASEPSSPSPNDTQARPRTELTDEQYLTVMRRYVGQMEGQP